MVIDMTEDALLANAVKLTNLMISDLQKGNLQTLTEHRGAIGDTFIENGRLHPLFQDVFPVEKRGRIGEDLWAMSQLTGYNSNDAAKYLAILEPINTLLHDYGKKNKAKSKGKRIGKIIAAIAVPIGVIVAAINIMKWATGADSLPEMLGWEKASSSVSQPAALPTSSAAPSQALAPSTSSEYTISLAISDTISENFEPTKKIVATASADTANMTITAVSSTETFGPFNMTRESDRRYLYLAIFEQVDTYTVTITAESVDGQIATSETVIENEHAA